MPFASPNALPQLTALTTELIRYCASSATRFAPSGFHPFCAHPPSTCCCRKSAGSASALSSAVAVRAGCPICCLTRTFNTTGPATSTTNSRFHIASTHSTRPSSCFNPTAATVATCLTAAMGADNFVSHLHCSVKLRQWIFLHCI